MSSGRSEQCASGEQWGRVAQSKTIRGPKGSVQGSKEQEDVMASACLAPRTRGSSVHELSFCRMGECEAQFTVGPGTC